LGYGEEVDLCFRAAGRGYVHVLDDATFVFHEGGRSFGRRRERRMRRGERMMRERYPEYIPRISEFIKTDPIAPARARVLDELRRALVSGDTGLAMEDAAMAVRAMVRDQGARREVFVYARMTDPDRADGSAVEYVDGGVRVRLVAINGAPRTMLSRLGVGGDAVGGDFARFVADVRAGVVHVHDLAGESLDLLGAAHVRAIRGALKNVPAFVMGSQSIADRYAAARVLPPSARVHVAPPGMAEDIERVYEEVMK
jgi:hypothetical protein